MIESILLNAANIIFNIIDITFIVITEMLYWIHLAQRIIAN